MKKLLEIDVKSVKDIRAMSGLSQTKFAEKYHIPVSTIEAWERGTRKPTDYLLEHLAIRVALDQGATTAELLAFCANRLREE